MLQGRGRLVRDTPGNDLIVLQILYSILYNIRNPRQPCEDSVTETARKPGRGRPRLFDPAEAIHVAQTLFHRAGYEGVSLTDLTGAIGITPPSFYAAFGSKAGLFREVLARYRENDGVPFGAMLRPGRDMAEALGEVLEEAARRYAADPQARGCLVLAGCHALEPDARAAARTLQQAAIELIRDFVAAERPDAAPAVANYMATVTAGLSAEARAGATPDALLQVARDAASALPMILARKPD